MQSAGTAICYAWRVDNTGPHSYDEAALIVDAVEALFPKAAGEAKRKAGRGVVASDAFDDFIQEITPYANELPVITQEIGDTWVFGADADPYKIATYRAATRAYAECMKHGGDVSCLARSPNSADYHLESMSDDRVAALRAFERLLLVSTEHTWGWNGGVTQRKSWSNPELQQSLLTDPEFKSTVGTWRESRAFVPNAVAALPEDSHLLTQIRLAFADIWRGNGLSALDDLISKRKANQWSPSQVMKRREKRQSTGLDQQKAHINMKMIGDTVKSFDAFHTEQWSVHKAGDILKFGAFEIGFDTHGAISHLKSVINSSVTMSNDTTVEHTVIWADKEHTIGRIWYQGMDRDFFKQYIDAYIAGPSAIDPEIAAENYFKPNMMLSALSANTTLKNLFVSDSNRILLDLSLPQEVHDDRGAPRTLGVQIDSIVVGKKQPKYHNYNQQQQLLLNFTLRWMNKTATHVPETIWLSNVPSILGSNHDSVVTVSKLGESVKTVDADLQCNGNRETCGVHLHGFDDGGVTIHTSPSFSHRTDNNKNNTYLTTSVTSMQLLSTDSQLVSIGSASPVPTPLVVPNITGGIHFALVGNIWNTNYPFWYVKVCTCPY